MVTTTTTRHRWVGYHNSPLVDMRVRIDGGYTTPLYWMSILGIVWYGGYTHSEFKDIGFSLGFTFVAFLDHMKELGVEI